MKIKYLSLYVFLLIFATACGPKPAEVSAPEVPIKLQFETTPSIEKFGEYEVTPGLMSLFLWPNEEDQILIAQRGGPRDIIEIAADVGENSTNMDKLYNRLTPAMKEKEDLNSLRMEKEDQWKADMAIILKEKMQEVLEKYSCLLEPSNRNKCKRIANSGDDRSKVATPSNCNQLKNNPWKNNKDAKACKEQEDLFKEPLEAKFQNENKDLLARINELEDLITRYTNQIDDYSKMIMNAVDSENDDAKRKNWVFVDFKTSRIEHSLDPNKAPKLSLVFTIKSKDHVDQFLYYDSANEKEIVLVDSNLVLEKGHPTLKFKLFEKGLKYLDTDANKPIEVVTGNYYEINLRRSLQKFGILYVGKVYKFNKEGKSLGDGMMKIILTEKIKSADE